MLIIDKLNKYMALCIHRVQISFGQQHLSILNHIKWSV